MWVSSRLEMALCQRVPSLHCSCHPAFPRGGRRFVKDAALVQRLQGLAANDAEGLRQLLLRLEGEGWLQRIAAHLPPPHTAAAVRPQQQHQAQPRQPRQQQKRQRQPTPDSPGSSPGLTAAEAAAAARECQAAAAAAAAAAPPEPWERQASQWMQQAQRQAQQWESGVQPYDTSWLEDCSCIQQMLPPQGQPRQRVTIHAVPAAAAPLRQAAQPAAATQPAAAARPAGAVRGRQQVEQQAQSSGEAATAVGAAARPTAPSPQRHVHRLQGTHAAAAAGGDAPSAQPPALCQPGSAPGNFQALLDGLPISDLPDGATGSPRLAPAPAPGDVLLFCRRCGWLGGWLGGGCWCSLHGAQGARCHHALLQLPICLSPLFPGAGPAACRGCRCWSACWCCRPMQRTHLAPESGARLGWHAHGKDSAVAIQASGHPPLRPHPGPRSHACRCLVLAQGAHPHLLAPPAESPMYAMAEVGGEGGD